MVVAVVSNNSRSAGAAKCSRLGFGYSPKDSATVFMVSGAGGGEKPPAYRPHR